MHGLQIYHQIRRRKLNKQYTLERENVRYQKNLADSRKALVKNIRAFEKLSKKDRLDIVKRGEYFAVYIWDDAMHFIPARWIAYGSGTKSNDKTVIAVNRINKLLGVEGPEAKKSLEKALDLYCESLGGEPVRKNHLFWRRDCITKLTRLLTK